MSGSFRHDIAGGAGDLIVQAVQSPNYVAGSAGWQIKKDGSAEFNDATIRGGEVIDGTALYYSPSPGAGNLTASTSAAAGTDSSGNAYLAGDTTYYNAGGNVYLAVNIYQDTLSFYASTTGEAGPWTQQSTLAGSAAGNLFITAQDPYLLNPLFPTSTLLNTPHGGLGLITSTTPSTRAVAVDGADVQIGSGYALYASDPAGTDAESWHAMSLANGWAAVSGNVTAKYRLTPENEVQVIGAISGTSATSSTFFTLPSAYRPASQQQLPCGATTGVVSGHAPYIQVSTAGVLSVQSVTVPTTGMTIVFNGRFPLNA